MLTIRRVIIATLCGLLFGLICMGLASSNPNPEEPLTCTAKWMIIISRTMMGFMIGISALRMPWWLHGLALGFIASIPMAIPVIHRPMIAIGSLIMGLVYGVLTELITSVLFKARMAGGQS